MRDLINKRPRSCPRRSQTKEPRPHAHPGFFLVLDGPDGGGKTTQAARLADWLRDQGLDVVTCRDPGGTALGDRLRSILLDRDTVAISLRAEMLLYMASRAQLVEEVIAPALAAGRVVVSRPVPAGQHRLSRACGGTARKRRSRWSAMVATSGLLPDLTLVLDIAPAVARARVGAARDRIEDRPLVYQRTGPRRAIWRPRAATPATAPGTAGCPYYPAPIVLIDASADPETVFERIKSEVERVLALDPRP